MATDVLLAGARERWETWARAPVSFPGAGGVCVVASPDSGLSPPGWVGLVALGGSAIVTAPRPDTAAVVRAAVGSLPGDAVTDAEAVRAVLPVTDVLGPAALAYASADGFRPVAADEANVRRLPQGAAGSGALDDLVDQVTDEEAAEAGIVGITSPAFVVRSGGRVVAAAGYEVWPDRVAHVCVLTGARWRGRGLARAVGSAAVAHAFAAGLLPQWRARGPASRRVAAALGFRKLGAQLSIQLAADAGMVR
ncbi:GNAT family N-acetyltransferase [Streptomyces marincola]|uniref:GNAT family N-acetyltransferase n=1 Tax=Streptomyces marincola TaxID=2878388 RepID=UPI001CF4F416|nr:GNAT family N-acetyltransferase [Streptomyces marincola]UCM89427.1 GNAT family N-acetyltransferase [Streptomyces marincola]